ncbi:hypothetical protein RIF29_33620 [Crotalaria pallida]|uniref:Uncharacterized protein n=1 Tax=Crotalaria pallida TaxID=3830 RepID=A0AAN9HQT6_CROPI
MKKSTFTWFALFFLVAITTRLPYSATAQAVLDTDGVPLVNGGKYYILPFNKGGGGIGLVQTGTDTCPLTIAQSPDEDSDGIPVTISSPNKIFVIKQRHPLELKFSDTDLPSCTPTPAKWNVVEDELSAEGFSSIKVTNDSEKEPGWFNIRSIRVAPKSYKLVFRSPDNATENIGFYIDNNKTRRVVVTKNKIFPLVVQFKSAATGKLKKILGSSAAA